MILAALTCLFFTFIWQVGEHDSCLRQAARKGTATVAAAAYYARLKDAQAARSEGRGQDARDYEALADQYAEAWRQSQPLDCSYPFPDTTVQVDESLVPPRP
jgi:hypothetical protein